MPATQYVPWMVPGHHVRNLLVAVGYVLFTLPFLWLMLPVMVWYDMDDITVPLSVLPGIERGGGGFSAAAAFGYVFVPYFVALMSIPGPGPSF
jgi:hypothetical protein